MKLGIRTLAVGLAGSFLSANAVLGASHLWQISEVFSTADGSVQFIEMHECCGGTMEHQLQDKWVLSDATGTQYTFQENLEGNTADRYLLLATDAFAALPGAPTPDFIIPENFFSLDADTLTYWFYNPATMSWKSGALPLDGINSLDRDGNVAVNSPTNYAGETGSVDASCAAPTLVAGAPGVSFDARAFDGFVDSRAESTDGINVNLGIDAVTLAFSTPIENVDGAPLSAAAFTISDTGGSAPTITGIDTSDDQTVTVLLSDHISLQERTTLSVAARAQCDAKLTIEDSITIGYLPADVDQNGCVSPFDLLTFRQYVNGALPPVGVVDDYVDTNRDGALSPFDLLTYRQLVNGAGNATQSWSGACLP